MGEGGGEKKNVLSCQGCCRPGYPKWTYEYIPHWISLEKIKEVDQEIKRGLMSIFLIEYALKAKTKLFNEI